MNSTGSRTWEPGSGASPPSQSSRLLAASMPILRSGIRTVVNGGLSLLMNSMSLYPVMDTSAGQA